MVAVDEQTVADALVVFVVGLGFGFFVHVPSVAYGVAFDDSVGVGEGPGVEVVVVFGNFVEDGVEVVAVLFAVAGFEGVGFDDEKGVVVPGGDLGGFPGEGIMVGAAPPAGYDFGNPGGTEHPVAVDDGDDGPVGFFGPAADVGDDEVAVCDFCPGKGFGLLPYAQAAVAVFDEFCFPEGAGACDGLSPEFACLPGWFALFPGEHGVLLVVETVSGGLEGFVVGGGKFGFHLEVVVAFFEFVGVVPVDAFEGGALLPLPPVVGRHAGDKGFVVFYRQLVTGNFKPGDEDGGVLAGAGFGGLVFEVEEVAYAFGGGFHDDEGARDVGNGSVEGLDDVFGAPGGGGFPDANFGHVYHGEIEGAEGVGFLGGAYPDDAAALANGADFRGAFKGREGDGAAFGRIGGGYPGDHPADVAGLLLDVGDDNAVPVAVVE